MSAIWPILDQFSRLSQEEADKILDPYVSWLVKASETEISLEKIINLSLTSGTFPESLQEAVVKPLLKKPSLDPVVPANYFLVPSLQFLGKVVERMAEEQLQAFLDDAPFQSGFHLPTGQRQIRFQPWKHLK